MPSISVQLIHDFDDPALQERWVDLLAWGDTDTVFLTWHWQRTWWESFGRGQLLLVAAERDGQIVALAPLFSDGGMIFFVGSGGSDYLDFLGDIEESQILEAILDGARAAVPDFLGYRFYHIPDGSRTGARLQAAASRLALQCFDEGALPAPALILTPENAVAAARKKSLLRHERFFQTHGHLSVQHLREAQHILPHLNEFFAQHISRWAVTPFPSLFNNLDQREFYRRLVDHAAQSGWLRFTRLDWQDRPIAFHFGFHYRNSFLWYKPSFAFDLARRSPGEVLLRQLLLAAMDEKVHTFDFGVGDEAFKRRFATHVTAVRTWGLYPIEKRTL